MSDTGAIDAAIDAVIASNPKAAAGLQGRQTSGAGVAGGDGDEERKGIESEDGAGAIEEDTGKAMTNSQFSNIQTSQISSHLPRKISIAA